MKKLAVILLALVVPLLNSCTQNSPVSPSYGGQGSLSLRLDKATAPSGVTTINAYLSRSGYDTLKASLSLVYDSSASITMTDIPVGQWHLRVDALDNGGYVLYSGSTDVMVSGGVTTQVSLTLQPATGNVEITVNWGSGQLLFTDYLSNPVFTPAQNPSNPANISEAKVILDNGMYKMWYMASYSPYATSLWYAESNDGVNWTNKTSLPILNTTDSVYWDYGYFIASGAVMKDGSLYRMYYNAIRSSYGQSSVGLATSADGISWQKYPVPVLTPDSLNYHLGANSVLKVNGTYYLYYNSSPVYNYDAWVVNVATSPDGIHWTEYSGNPVLSATAGWEGAGVTYPSVIYDDSQFVMLYMNSNRSAYGIAYSNDGLNWTKRSSQPVYTISQTGRNLLEIDYPCLVRTPEEYRVYYTSVQNVGYSPYALMTISYASSPAIR